MRRRRQYFIDKTFQLRFILIFTVLALIVAVWTAVFLYGTLSVSIEDALFSSHIHYKTIGSIIVRPLLAINVTVILLLAMLGMLAFFVISVKLQGNISSLEEAMEEISEGNLNIRFSTNGSTGGYVRSNLISMANRFADEIGRMRKALEECKDKLEKRDEKFSHGNAEELIENLSKCGSKLRESMKEFIS